MLPVIPQDKANHFAYGAAIGAAVSLIAGPGIGLGAGVAFGVAKEAWDAWGKHKARRAGQVPLHGVELADAAWTAAGALAATVTPLAALVVP